MEHLHVVVEISGVKLEVIGNYFKGEAASLDSPGEDASVEIEQVLTESGDDIGALFSSNKEMQHDLESAVIDAHIDGKVWAKTEAALARRELAREEA